MATAYNAQWIITWSAETANRRPPSRLDEVPARTYVIIHFCRRLSRGEAYRDVFRTGNRKRRELDGPSSKKARPTIELIHESELWRGVTFSWAMANDLTESSSTFEDDF